MAGPAAKPQVGKNWEARRGSMGGAGGGGGEGIAATEDQQMEVFVVLFNYTCKFEKVAQRSPGERVALFF